jgi:GT2 family glycosyltransferase
MIHVCVPVLKRYDLLYDLLRSLRESTASYEVWLLNNGRDQALLKEAIKGAGRTRLHVHTPAERLGLAAAWNWFIANVPEDRVIANDDVTFAPDSLAQLVSADADLAWAAGVGFSCFLLRDSCVRKIGLFDETISPGYAYYEDEDYLQRLDGRGTRASSATAMNVECGVRHFHSATLKASSLAEIEEHHRRFKVAQNNYIKKWALEETFK